MSEIDRLKEAILEGDEDQSADAANAAIEAGVDLSLIHISEPTRHTSQSRMPASA